MASFKNIVTKNDETRNNFKPEINAITKYRDNGVNSKKTALFSFSGSRKDLLKII